MESGRSRQARRIAFAACRDGRERYSPPNSRILAAWTN